MLSGSVGWWSVGRRSVVLTKPVRNAGGRLTCLVKMQVIDLDFYLKCHSSTGVFYIFCWCKSTTWFVSWWNIGCNRVKLADFISSIIKFRFQVLLYFHLQEQNSEQIVSRLLHQQRSEHLTVHL